jgi:hypothetical protein
LFIQRSNARGADVSAELALIDRGAVLSDCGRYRYVLWRRWDKTKPRLVFIMLNPSTADAETDDATIRVCMGRARLSGYGGIRVINLYGWRATDPTELKTAADPIGEANRYLETHHGAGGDLNIAAWGDGGLLYGRSRERYREALNILCVDYAIRLYCLGLTKAGQPKHPLRISYRTEPVIWIDGRADYLNRFVESVPAP